MRRVQEMGQKAKDLSDRRRRNRKHGDLKAALKEEYDSRKVWTRVTCKEIAAKFGLSVSQVYKWGWDYRKKQAEAAALPAADGDASALFRHHRRAPLQRQALLAPRATRVLRGA